MLLPVPWGINPFDDYAVIDYGDCWLDVHNPSNVKDTIVAHARTILEAGTRMLTLAGDHYISYPLLLARAEKYGRPLSLIHFNAHCDPWPDEQPDGLNHGSMFYKAINDGQAINDGLVNPAHSVQIGIRILNDDFMGVPILEAAWVHEHGVSSTIARIVEIVGARPTYFTLDVDGLDPAFAPGTGTPAPGGLSTAQALSIVRGLTAVDIIGADVVEVAPAYDHADITALAAAHVASELICLFRHRGCFAVETRELTATVSLPDSHGSTHLYRGSNFVIRIEE